MINLQKAIRDLIQEELSKNTEGLIFDVSLYNVKTNSLIEDQIPVGQTYATEQRRFIPVLIEEISGEYANLKNLTSAEAFINTSFLIPTEETDFNNMAINETFNKVSTALDKLRKRIISRTLPLGGKSYILDNDYSLKILNDTESFSSDYIELSIKILDDDDGAILRDNKDFELKKENNQLVFITSEANQFFTYQKDVYYNIRIQDQGNGNLTITISNGVTTENLTLSYSNYSLDDLILGGSLIEINRLSIGSNSSNIVFKLEDFTNYNLISGSTSMLDTSDVTPSYEIGELGNIVFGFSIPNPTTNQFTMGNGLNYQQFELTLEAYITDSVFVGNDVKYYLDDIEIFPFFRDESFVSETDASQVVGSQITKNTAIQSILGKEYSIYMTPNKKLIDLAKKVTSETPEPNEVYTLKVVYPLFEREYNVIVTQGALGITNNSPISLSIKLDLASDILLNQ